MIKKKKKIKVVSKDMTEMYDPNTLYILFVCGEPLK